MRHLSTRHQPLEPPTVQTPAEIEPMSGTASTLDNCPVRVLPRRRPMCSSPMSVPPGKAELPAIGRRTKHRMCTTWSPSFAMPFGLPALRVQVRGQRWRSRPTRRFDGRVRVSLPAALCIAAPDQRLHGAPDRGRRRRDQVRSPEPGWVACVVGIVSRMAHSIVGGTVWEPTP
jgi:hypothetical protein